MLDFPFILYKYFQQNIPNFRIVTLTSTKEHNESTFIIVWSVRFYPLEKKKEGNCIHLIEQSYYRLEINLHYTVFKFTEYVTYSYVSCGDWNCRVIMNR